MSDKMSPNDINIGRLHAKIDALTAERDSALKRADDADVGWSEAALSWLQRVDEVSVERDSALARLKAISGHVEFIRHDEKRHKEVGKEKVAWDKLNGALSAIERELSADAGPPKCHSADATPQYLAAAEEQDKRLRDTPAKPVVESDRDIISKAWSADYCVECGGPFKAGETMIKSEAEGMPGYLHPLCASRPTRKVLP